MKNKILKILICAGAFVAAVPTTWAVEGEAAIASLQERWLSERDVIVEQIADLWLQDKADPKLKKMLMRLVTLEVRLSTREGTELYTGKLGSTSDPDKAVAKVALAYLQGTGWSPDTSKLVEGRTFEVERTYQAPVAKAKEAVKGPSWRNGEGLGE